MKSKKEFIFEFIKLAIPKTIDILYIVAIYFMILAFVAVSIFVLYQSDELYAHLNPDVPQEELDIKTESKFVTANILNNGLIFLTVLSVFKIFMVVLRKENK